MTILNTDNGCESQAFILVEADLEIPDLSVEIPLEINCFNPQVQLISSSTSNSPLTFEWSTTDGSIVGESEGPTLIVDQNGIYEVVLTDLSNSCTNTATISVEMNLSLIHI